MMIERITGRPYPDTVQEPIIRPLGLTGTYLPATGEHDIRGPHPHGYAPIDVTRADVTRIEPFVPWAAGALVSTDGRAATIVWTEPPSQQPDMMAILTRALCP